MTTQDVKEVVRRDAKRRGIKEENCVFVAKPLVIIYQDNDKKVICAIHPGDWNYQCYGLLISDLVQHVANAFHVREHDVWEWVDKERFNPERIKVQQLPDGTLKSLVTKDGPIRGL
jgi:hypothetical protein